MSPKDVVLDEDPVDVNRISKTSSLFNLYFDYIRQTEPPVIYHRWSYLTTLGAIIGRKAFIHHGHFRIFPNLYVMLIGEPAARKSTSIKMVRKLLSGAGYSTFAAEKTSKEKFLIDLEGLEEVGEVDDNTRLDLKTAENLWGAGEEGSAKEVFIVADEFNEFAGPNNLDFYTTLGNLWDWDDLSQPFRQRFKTSKSVSIYQPTINILSGNTQELFARAFPPEAIGSGFLSRLLLIFGERSRRRITFPPPPDPELKIFITNFLQQLMIFEPGEMKLSEGALVLLDDIYQHDDVFIKDVRFKNYQNRRFTQLLKICLIISVAQFKKEIDENDVLFASTILCHAELLMPKAIGEFGKSKNSDVAHKIVTLIEGAMKPVTQREIWAQVHKDINQQDLMAILNGLVAADKLQLITKSKSGVNGFLPRKEVLSEPRFVDWSLLTAEEREMI